MTKPVHHGPVAHCDKCGQKSTVPPPQLWEHIDKILCRFCGDDLKAQYLERIKKD